MLKGFTRRFPPLNILTEEQANALHRAVLDVLRQTGVRFEGELALKDLEKLGCQVDHEEKRVRFPEYLVEEAIRRTPTSHRIKARDPKNDIIFGGDTVYFRNFPGMQTVDLDTWEPRDPTRQEYSDLITVFDALPNMHAIGPYPYYGFAGVPPVMRLLEGIAIKISNSTKVLINGNASDADQFHIQMVKVAGGEAVLSAYGSAPLTWYDDQLRATYRALEAGWPMYLLQGTAIGATGPATVAGTVVVNLAELLSLLVLIQLLKPGTRVHVASDTYPQNMRSGAPGFGRISCSLVKAVENQMTRRYGIPRRDSSGGPVNSKKSDFQTGYERSLNALVSALSGSNLISMHSALYGEMAAHPVQAIMDDDVAGMIGRFIEGVTVDDETIALDLIEKVGPIPGNYLNTAHTREQWRREQFIPRAADDLTYPEWSRSGKKDCLDYARGVMEEILSSHKVSISLTSSQKAEIGRILKEARQYYRERGMISDDEWAVYQDKVLKSPDYPFA
jgi:trimethylamine--corrinoid protein Co-methyltransferase